MHARLHARIVGLVQGVFYRASTRVEARALGLLGWVRNCPDGSVELCAEGPRERLEALLLWCRKGPAGARVDAVDVSWEAAVPGELGAFDVRR